MPEWVSDLLSSAAVAVLTAIITVRLSLRQFRSQRWWDRKEAAYSQIIDALHDLQRYTDTLGRDMVGERVTEEHMERLRKQHESAYDQLYRLTNTGAFVISKRAAEILIELNKSDRSVSQWSPDFFADQAKAFGVALAAMRAEAKRDLGVK